VSANDHVHSRKSAHYAGAALDWHGADGALDKLSMFYKQFGHTVYWRVAGHYNHLHVEASTYEVALN
jgi:hypothetical protein